MALVARMAIPSTAPASTSAMRSPPALATISATVLPLLLVWSSVIVVSVIVPLLSSTGASLTAVIEVDSAAVAAAMAVLPPLVVVLTVTRISLPAVVEKPAT